MPDMNILEILNQLEENQVYIALDGEDLEASFLQEEISDEIISLLKEHKVSLIEYLTELQEKYLHSKIPEIEAKLAYSLSSAQMRMWIVSQYEEVSQGYNLPTYFYLKGNYNINALKKAILSVIDRHEILRTVFKTNDNAEVYQQVIPSNEFSFHINYQDVRKKKDPDRMTRQWVFDDYYRPFDLENGPLLRVSIFRLADNQYLLYYNLHHIIGDGWSLNILSRDVLAYYEVFTKEVPLALPNLRIQYKDFAEWEQKQLESKTYQKHKDYWLEKLSGDIPVLDLPTSIVRPVMRTYNGQLVSNFLDEKTTLGIRSYLKKNGGTLFTFLLANLKILLSKYTRQNDIIVGIPVAGRENLELGDQIGVYINTLAVRNTVNSKQSFDAFYNSLKESLLSDYGNQAYPFDLLVDQLDIVKDLSRNPLFDIMVAMRNTEESNDVLNINELDLSATEYNRPVKVKFDLEIGFKENDSHIGIELMYNSDVYEYATMKVFIVHFKELLNKVLLNSKTEVASLEYLTLNDKKQLAEFNDTKVEYQSNRTILDEFNDLVIKRPNAPAVSYQHNLLSYKILDEYSNQLAHYLRAKYKVEKGDFVGIHQHRSHWMLVSILGILKVGAAYVPIDMDYSLERISFIQHDSAYQVCINEAELEAFEAVQFEYSKKALNVKIEGNTPAYAIYTSGTSGRPKGVLNRHESLYNRLLWMRDGLNINSFDILIQKTPYTFDVSVWELLMLCVSGSKLVFAKSGGHKDPIYLHQQIAENKISVVHFVSSMLGMFLEVLDVNQLETLCHIVCSGEVLPSQMVERIQKSLPWVKIHNFYGPTEAAIDVTWVDLTEVNTLINGVSIGKPVANTKIYIVDQDLKPQAVGVAGELLIEGVQVASGYLNRPELSAEKFIDNLFTEGYCVYRTGDLCKWLSNGEIAYMGRLDHQVKIRGNRIELGEIEHQMDGSGFVDQGVVVVKELSSGDKTLIGYIKLKGATTETDVYENLKNSLPEYMVPSRLIQVESFPMTSSGKVDRKRLVANALPESEKVNLIVPSTDLEKDLWAIWKKVLEHSDFGIESNFFRIGGDSILSIRMVSLVNKKYGLNLKLGEFYEYNTIQTLSEYIENSPSDSNTRNELLVKLESQYTSLVFDRSEIEALYPMSDIQRGMVYTTLNNPESGIYHDQFVYTIPKIEDDNLLIRAVEIMVQRHATLRTSFDLNHYNEPLQVLYNSIVVGEYITMHDLTDLNADDRRKKIDKFISVSRGKIFNFSKAPLWQIDIFTIDEIRCIYLIQFHHCILDGWSVALFNTELFNIYQALKMGTYSQRNLLATTVKDVVFQERLEKESESLKQYWKDTLRGYKKLDLFSEDDIYETYFKHLDKEFSQKLRDYTKEGGLHHRNIILGAFIYVLRTLSFEEDLLIGQVSNNRPAREDGDRVLGCFLNTLPMRIKPFNKRQMSWKSYFLKVEGIMEDLKRKDRLTIYEISKLASKEQSGENPFFDIIYNYTDFNNTYKNIEYNQDESRVIETEDILSFEQTNTFLDINIRDHASGNIEFQLIQSKKFNISTDHKTIIGYVEKVLQQFLVNPEGTLDQSLILNKKDKSRRYWHELLSGELPVLNLPKKVENNEGANTTQKLSFKLSNDNVTNIKSYVEQVDSNIDEYLLACWNILLHLYNRQEDLMVVLSKSNQSLPIRSNLKKHETFNTYFSSLRHQLVLSQKHYSEIPRNLEAEVEVRSRDIKTSQKHDLSFCINNGSTMILEYNLAVYEPSMIEGLARHFGQLIDSLSGNYELVLDELSYLTEEERKELLVDFNATTIPYSKNQTLIDLFESQVLNNPDSVAVHDVFNTYTYQELNNKVNQVAFYLHNNFGSNRIVIGVLMSRSVDLPILLLGILKSGNAYVPIDPTLPLDRIQYILEHSETKLLILNQDIDFKNELEDIQRIQCDEIWDSKALGEYIKPNPKDTAYIIYTSGSTGKPKGVEVGHQSLLNFLISIQNKPGVKASDVLYAVTTYSFDISILEFFVPLISGATLYVANEEILSDSFALIDDLERVKPTIVQATPSFYQLLFESKWTGDPQLKVLCGGDTLGISLAQKLVQNTGEVWNMYGPTETTIWSTAKQVTVDTHPNNIGKPINNTSIYILNEQLSLLPKGITGKLFIGGDGLAKGYFKNTVLTEERFIPNPFGPGKFYDTGDLARWLPEGEIEFLGRNDFQVKIRGYRIELEEIQNIILQYSDLILRATLTLRELKGSKFLVAYYTTLIDAQIDKSNLKYFLASKLPAYMVPNFFKELDTIPLNINGKVDHKELPEITDKDLLKKDFVKPRSELEEEIISIIKRTLGNQIQQVGIIDNFFDLGLDSLMSIKVLYEINAQLGLNLKPLDLFQYPNVQSLVDNVLQANGQTEYEVLVEPEDIDSIIDIF